MSAASLSPAFGFVISSPDRAPTVGNKALREDFETGSRSPSRFSASPLETAVRAFFRNRKLNSSFPDTTPGGRDRPWDASTDEQRAIFNKVAGSIVTEISEVAGVGFSP